MNKEIVVASEADFVAAKIGFANAILDKNCVAFVGAAVNDLGDNQFDYVEVGVVNLGEAPDNMREWVNGVIDYLRGSTGQVFFRHGSIGTNPMSRALYDMRRERVLKDPRTLARIAEIIR